MELKKGWWLTASGGKNFVVYQPKEYGNLFREFTAKNPQEAQAIALQIIKDFENVNQRPSSEL